MWFKFKFQTGYFLVENFFFTKFITSKNNNTLQQNNAIQQKLINKTEKNWITPFTIKDRKTVLFTKDFDYKMGIYT